MPGQHYLVSEIIRGQLSLPQCLAHRRCGYYAAAIRRDHNSSGRGLVCFAGQVWRADFAADHEARPVSVVRVYHGGQVLEGPGWSAFGEMVTVAQGSGSQIAEWGVGGVAADRARGFLGY